MASNGSVKEEYEEHENGARVGVATDSGKQDEVYAVHKKS